MRQIYSLFILFLTVPAFLFAQSQIAVSQTEFRGQSMPYAAFDKLSKTTLTIKGAKLNIGFAPGKINIERNKILTWLEKSAHTVEQYYGSFPVRSVRILIVPSNGRGILGGQSFGYKGAAIRLYLGANTRPADLEDDWVAIHEMVHLALPYSDEKHLWLSEGLAVYIESIARVQNGELKEERIWREFMRDMPKGLPGFGDKGLDHTPTWGRRYWGGALFCLLADIEIRKRTNNKMGLQSAVKNIMYEGGNIEKFWSINRILKAGDNATGTNVLRELYEQMAANPVDPDLKNLWQELGVDKRDGKVRINDTAPLAEIRRAIVANPD